MPKGCCVTGCTANTSKNPDRKFYIIPTNGARRNKWLQAINRASVKSDGSSNQSKRWSPKSSHFYVCSVHFISGCKVNDPTHPDYVPSIFPHNENASNSTPIATVQSKSTGKMDRYQRYDKRRFQPAPENRARKRLKLLDTQSPRLQPQKSPDLNIPGDRSVHWSSVNDMTSSESESESQDEVPLTESEGTDTPVCDESEETINLRRERDEALDKIASLETEREMLYTEITNLRHERDEALDRVASLEKLVSASALSSESVEGSDEVCKMMTGISWGVFLKLYLFLSTCLIVTKHTKVSLRDQMFLTLVKLRHNLSFEFLAQIRGIPKSTMVDYFWKWIDLMNSKLAFLINWADRETIYQTIQPVFKEKFPRLTSIIDCFEIFIEAPKNLLARAQCYSNYKKHTTIKFLISCSPHGSINFISKAWGGRASDIQIVRQSNFISPIYHMPGDQILADRGFTLKDDFAASCSAELITPAFTKGKKQLSAREVEHSRSVSSVRIHIERVIGLMKNRFNILKGTLPIRCVQSLKDESVESEVSSCDKIIHVCAALTNLGPSIVFKD